MLLDKPRQFGVRERIDVVEQNAWTLMISVLRARRRAVGEDMNLKASMVVLVDQPPYRLHPVATGEERRYVAQSKGSIKIGSLGREHLVLRGGRNTPRCPRPPGLEDIA